MANDFAKGGKFAFASARDPQVPPFSCIQDDIRIPVSPMRWKKEGNDILIVKEGTNQIDINFPITFQGQHAFVTGIQGKFVYLDRKVINRDLQNFILMPNPNRFPILTKYMRELGMDGPSSGKERDLTIAMMIGTMLLRKFQLCRIVLHVTFNHSNLLLGRSMLSMERRVQEVLVLLALRNSFFFHPFSKVGFSKFLS